MYIYRYRYPLSLSPHEKRPYIGTYIYPYLYSENKKELLEMTEINNSIEVFKKGEKISHR